MATKNLNKKTSKSVRTTVVVPPLNKKNAEKFGDQLFQMKGGVITCLALCDGELQNGKVGGRTTHCAVGEVYHVFVNPSLSRVLASEDRTDEAIKAIAAVAKLKNDSEEGRAKMEDALSSLVDTNDSISGEDSSGAGVYAARAEQVQQTWREEVIPLLK